MLICNTGVGNELISLILFMKKAYNETGRLLFWYMFIFFVLFQEPRMKRQAVWHFSYLAKKWDFLQTSGRVRHRAARMRSCRTKRSDTPTSYRSKPLRSKEILTAKTVWTVTLCRPWRVLRVEDRTSSRVRAVWSAPTSLSVARMFPCGVQRCPCRFLPALTLNLPMCLQIFWKCSDTPWINKPTKI